MLEASPTNLSILKRKVCVAKARGDLKGACEQLHEILLVHGNDVSCWLEMAELLTQQGDFSGAAFCCEELVLLSPNDPVHFCRMADAYYSVCTVESLVKARKNYSLSLTLLRPRANVRAVYGLVATCNLLLTTIPAHKK